MKTFVATMLGLLFCGCASRGLRIEMEAEILPGDTLDFAETATTPTSDFSVTITNLGPADKGGDVEVLNGDQSLGRVPVGESRTFTTSGEKVRLRVRTEKGLTRFKALVLGTPR